MIHLENVSFSYHPGAPPVFTDLDLEIELLSSLVIAGADASGKTTLAKLIKGMLQPDSGTITSPGDLVFDAGYVGGDPYDSLVGVSVEEDVVFGLENLGLPAPEMRERLAQALEWTGLTGMEKRLTHTLSGGEQQKLALAGMLAAGARVLIIDEAFAMLDRPSRLSIRSLLASLRRDPGLTLIEVTNDLEDSVAADRMIFLSEGSILFDGVPMDFLASPLGRRWSGMAGGLGALVGALFERGILPEPFGDRSRLTSFLLHHFSR
ncbi:MAG: ATP-binding cassette domain-containing protein [Deltaproteobacteria bacterium]